MWIAGNLCVCLVYFYLPETAGSRVSIETRNLHPGLKSEAFSLPSEWTELHKKKKLKKSLTHFHSEVIQTCTNTSVSHHFLYNLASLSQFLIHQVPLHLEDEWLVQGTAFAHWYCLKPSAELSVCLELSWLLLFPSVSSTLVSFTSWYRDYPWKPSSSEAPSPPTQQHWAIGEPIGNLLPSTEPCCSSSFISSWLLYRGEESIKKMKF